MNVYALTMVMSVVIAFTVEHCVINGKPLKKWIKVLFTGLPAILVTGLRYNVGTDSSRYKFAFENPDNTNVVLYFELLNRWIFKLINKAGGSFYTAVFIAAVLFYVFLFSEIFEDSPIPWLSSFMIFGLLYFFANMNIMRQMLALSMLFFSLIFIQREQYYNFLFCVMLDIVIHR